MIGKFLLIAALAGGCALAQDEPPGGGGGGGGMGGMGRGGGMDMGGGMMPRSQPGPFDRLTTMLSLDKDQKKADKALLDEAAKEAAPLRDKILASRNQIAAAVAAGKPQPEIDDLIKGHGLLMAQMSEIEGRVFQKIFSPLSAPQKQQGGSRAFAMMQGLFMKKDWNKD